MIFSKSCASYQRHDTHLEQSWAEDLSLLQPAERIVYQGLRAHRWGHCVRLEQERISWEVVLHALSASR
ncbi:Wadjet anti-phage system protein JetD domain-containing protein [Pseudoduganella sp. R-31]|uniref:Wadjet anti-phage system protein JetD domain-containing protein n=1 Tax=Pseudoduganella sp. R-31 TaxID=3404060 RepID=UPI003CF2BB7A